MHVLMLKHFRLNEPSPVRLYIIVYHRSIRSVLLVVGKQDPCNGTSLFFRVQLYYFLQSLLAISFSFFSLSFHIICSCLFTLCIVTFPILPVHPVGMIVAFPDFFFLDILDTKVQSFLYFQTLVHKFRCLVSVQPLLLLLSFLQLFWLKSSRSMRQSLKSTFSKNPCLISAVYIEHIE